MSLLTDHYVIYFYFNYALFLEYMDGCARNGNRSSETVLTKAFRLFDVDHDGFIDREEFSWAISYVAATAYDRDPDLNSNITFKR